MLYQGKGIGAIYVPSLYTSASQPLQAKNWPKGLHEFSYTGAACGISSLSNPRIHSRDDPSSNTPKWQNPCIHSLENGHFEILSHTMFTLKKKKKFDGVHWLGIHLLVGKHVLLCIYLHAKLATHIIC